MDKIVLQAEPRKGGRHNNRELRQGERVPAIVYGRAIEAQAVSLDRKALGQALHQAGTGLIEMELTGQAALHVLTREIQRHPTKHYVQHVDFYAVSMTQRVRVQITVIPEGVAPVMADPNMVLVRSSDVVEVECLPGDIPENLIADLTKLETLDDEILVSDLKIPENVKILTPGDHVLFAITASRAALEEEEAVEGAEAPAADEVEVIRKRKPEEEEE